MEQHPFLKKGGNERRRLETPVPEAEDDFFDNERHLVGVFDFDYDEIEDFETKNVEWRTRAQHVALTEDGIKYVTDRHPTMCGLSCTDAGKVSKTVPYDKITDCDVHEPAGMACCCIQKTLTSLIVDTASSGPESHELVLTGLHDPHALKQAVWEMKRQGTGAPSMPQSGANETNQLLREIRDEMRLLNQHLQGQ